MEAPSKKVKLLNLYLHEARYKSKAHTSSEEHNRKRDKRSGWLQGMCSAIAGVVSVGHFGNVKNCNDPVNLTLLAVTVTLSFIATAVGITISNYRYGEK